MKLRHGLKAQLGLDLKFLKLKPVSRMTMKEKLNLKPPTKSVIRLLLITNLVISEKCRELGIT